MSRRRPLRLLCSAAVALALALGACSPPPPAGGGSSGAATTGGASGGAEAWKGKSITILLQQKPDLMSPLGAATNGNGQILLVTQDTLAAGTPDGKLVPRVAKSWEQSSDGLSILITLNDNQKWSDGTPLTQDDILFTFNTYVNPQVKAPLGSQLAPIAGYDAVKAGTAKELSGVTKVGSNQIKITLAKPDAGFMYLLLAAYYYILPQAKLKDMDPTKLLDNPMWTQPGAVPYLGPMVMSQNVTGQRVVFTRNPNFRTPVQFETLVASLVTQDVATQQLASGEMDMTLLQPTDLAAVEKMSNVSIVKADSPGFDRYTVNIRKPYLKSNLVRQGLLTAIDRKGIMASIYSGLATPSNTSFLASGVDTSGINTYAYDPAKAKQLLQQGGWNFDQQLQIVQASGNAQRAAVDQVVLKNLQDAGVKAVIKPIDQAQVTQTLTDGSYDIFLYGGGNYVVDASIDIPILSCATQFPNGANLPNYCSQELDAVFDQTRTTTDPAKRAALFTQAAKIENNDVPMLWIARPQRAYALSPKITGGVKCGDGVNNCMFSLHEWTVK